VYERHSFFQRHVVVFPCRDPATNAKGLLDALPAQLGCRAVGREPAVAHGEHDFLLVLFEQLLIAAECFGFDVAGVDDVSLSEFFRFSDIEHDRTGVHEAHSLCGTDVRKTLAFESNFINHYGQPRHDDTRYQQGMIPAKFEQLVDHYPGIWRQRPRIIAVPGWLLTAIFALCVASSLGAQEERAQLDAVRDQIVRLEERMSSQRSQLDAERQALERIEKQIAERHRALADVREQSAAEQARLDELDSAAALARVELSNERDALGHQVLLSYMTGREELLKLVLNQENPAALGRMVTYYDYFNRFRSERIEAARVELERLAVLLRQARESRQRLDALAARHETQLRELETARTQRNEMLASLDGRLGESGEALESLRADERRLEELVLELGDILAAFPAGSEKPFASLKGQLAWPATGEIDESYGRLRNGERVKWNGVLLAAEPGTPVRAIYRGRVAFSDWLPGLGLLMILDHGDGYLSLYGHNEVLLREPGEWVAPGDVLGQVGSAGGRSGLYFELRHDQEPIDPRQWMRGAPARGR